MFISQPNFFNRSGFDSTEIYSRTLEIIELFQSVILNEFLWLGRKYVNGTFSDEEDVDEIDIQQLKDILNSDSEEPQC